MADTTHTLRWSTKLGYSCGHAFNDLCAAMWFTYLLVFLHMVLRFDNSYAGTVLLIGQLADGIGTTFVGIEVDRGAGMKWLKYGRRKSWHAFGTLCVLSSFAFIFMPCLGCRDSHQYAQLLYYGAFVIIFQFGWAAVQISHLSLIPYLTPDQHERTELTSLRYGFTVAANVVVYIVTWVTIGYGQHTNAVTIVQNVTSTIGPEDEQKFAIIVFIIMGLGVLSTTAFHLLVPEKCSIPNDEAAESLVQTPKRERISVCAWLKQPQFYQVAMLYMATRLFINVSQVYLPLYLQDTLQLVETSIAVLPLVMYSSGFVISFLMKYLNRVWGRKTTYLMGSILCLGASISIGVFGSGSSSIYLQYGVYASVALMGCGTSTILITSLGITADLIGPHVDAGAFVYGAMSLTDKVANGVAVMIIQTLHPCGDVACCSLCGIYYQNIMSYVIGGVIILAAVVLATLGPCKIGIKNPELPAVQADVCDEEIQAVA